MSWIISLIITTPLKGSYQSYYKRKNDPEQCIDSKTVVDSPSRAHILLNDAVLRGRPEVAGSSSPDSVTQKANNASSPSSCGLVMSPKSYVGNLTLNVTMWRS